MANSQDRAGTRRGAGPEGPAPRSTSRSVSALGAVAVLVLPAIAVGLAVPAAVALVVVVAVTVAPVVRPPVRAVERPAVAVVVVAVAVAVTPVAVVAVVAVVVAVVAVVVVMAAVTVPVVPAVVVPAPVIVPVPAGLVTVVVIRRLPSRRRSRPSFAAVVWRLSRRSWRASLRSRFPSLSACAAVGATTIRDTPSNAVTRIRFIESLLGTYRTYSVTDALPKQNVALGAEGAEGHVGRPHVSGGARRPPPPFRTPDQ